MSADDIIAVQDNGDLCFGDYTLKEKRKVEDFSFEGSSYKVKTFYEITKLEKNGSLMYESVPGTRVTGFKETESGLSFTAEGQGSCQLTTELDEETEYHVQIGDTDAGTMKTNLSGKLSISLELAPAEAVSVVIEKA